MKHWFAQVWNTKDELPDVLVIGLVETPNLNFISNRGNFLSNGSEIYAIKSLYSLYDPEEESDLERARR